jgi:cytidylate kinase
MRKIQTMPGDVSPFLGGVAAIREFPRAADVSSARPFVTISREGGAGGRTLAQQLIARLNELEPDAPPWRMWDRELVQEVATRHRIPESLVESVDERTRNWLEDLLVNLTSSESLSDETVYRHVSVTIRALAQAGRAVIVGRGGAFVTRDAGQGVHVRLVAPLEHRVALTAWRSRQSLEAARAEVKRQDAERAEFYRHYWGIDRVLPEHFTLTMNTAAMQVDQMVSCILTLLPQPAPARSGLEAVS